MEFTPTHQRVHDVIIVRDPSAAVCAVDAGIDALVVEAEPDRIDLLHRPFRVWVGGREHRAQAVVIGSGDGASPAAYRDWLAHDRHGNLLTDESRTSVDGVFARGCQAARDAIAWLADAPEPLAAEPVAA
jgi:thioredoxin reductase